MNFSAHTRFRSHDQSKNRSIRKDIFVNKAKKTIDKFLGNKVSCAILHLLISVTQQLMLIACLRLQIILSMTNIFSYFNSLSDQIGVPDKIFTFIRLGVVVFQQLPSAIRHTDF